MNSNIVLKSFFNYGSRGLARMDPEFAESAPVKEEQMLQRFPGTNIGQYVMRLKDSTVTKEFAGEEDLVGYIDIDSVDTEDGLLYSEEIRFGDRPTRAKHVLRKGDVLVSNVRPNRNAVAIITDRIVGYMASSGFTLLRMKSTSDLSPLFLFAYLKSNFAISQLVRRNRNSMYPAVVESDVHDLWVPQPDSEIFDKVSLQISKALSLQDEFFSLHRSQKEMLDGFLEPYGSPPSPLTARIGPVTRTIINRREVFSAGGAQRFDADFFRTEYSVWDRLCQQQGESFVLGDYFDGHAGRGLPRGEDDVPYIKQIALTNHGINWCAVATEPGYVKSGADCVRAGDILLACTAHEIYYIGRRVDYVRAVPENLKVNACVPDLIILSPNSVHPPDLMDSYVAAFLRHEAGLHQVQRCIRGLRGGHVYSRDVLEYVRVPVPPREWMAEFEDISGQIENVRNKAKTLVSEAVASVDWWIEDKLSS